MSHKYLRVLFSWRKTKKEIWKFGDVDSKSGSLFTMWCRVLDTRQPMTSRSYQRVECSLCRPKDLSFIPSTYIKRLNMLAYVCDPIANCLSQKLWLRDRCQTSHEMHSPLQWPNQLLLQSLWAPSFVKVPSMSLKMCGFLTPLRNFF